MAKYETARGQTGNIAFVFLPDSSSTAGGGKTALTNASAGLNIAVRREKSATFTAYSGANIGTITTLGTWASPGTGKCNFKEVDSTNAPGLYELHFEDAQFSTSDTSRKLVGMVQATGVAPTPFEVELTGADLQDGVRQGMTAIPNAAAGAPNGLPTIDSGGGSLPYDLGGSVSGNVAGNVGGKVIGGGIDTPTAVGAWVADGSGNAVATATAVTALQNDLRISGNVNDVAPTASGFTCNNALSATANFYNNSVLVFTSGTLKGLAREITGWTTGRVPTFSSAFPVAPANADTFYILGFVK